ncbi:uncharacterized protein LOC141898928 [Tubulanus polymorphus]|uniref:uncharacterized protein LOC141898928 n=1 Tax=Tubulanus polymorphus TaxID=672921 RepID=UPI003DA35412
MPVYDLFIGEKSTEIQLELLNKIPARFDDHYYSFSLSKDYETESRDEDSRRKKGSTSRRSCCVPYCTKSGYYHVEGHGVVSYFSFPSELGLRKQWLARIKRDEGDLFEITKNTFVCSQHFKKDDYRDVSSYSGRRYLKSTAIPSVFSCWEGEVTNWNPKKLRKPNKLVNLCDSRVQTTCTSVVPTEDTSEFAPTCEPISLFEDDGPDLLETTVTDNGMDLMSCSTTITHNDYTELLNRISNLELENEKLQSQVESLQSENRFTIDRLSVDNITFYIQVFQI